MTPRPRVLAVLGPTACGKSALGWALAQRFDGEILNCDSTAVYRGFDIRTDKVAPAEQQGIPHHLIDSADPTEVYTAAQYARDAAATIRAVHARGRLPILVGGTGDRKSTRLNSSHSQISYAVFCLKKKTNLSRSA